jgi:uncharacterized protein YbjT (DUF2867 family)
MSAEKFLVIAATGRTGRHTVQYLLEKGGAAFGPPGALK